MIQLQVNTTLGIKELFLDGNMPVNLEKFINTIQKNNLPYYETTKRENYIRTFHRKDADNKKQTQGIRRPFGVAGELYTMSHTRP